MSDRNEKPAGAERKYIALPRYLVRLQKQQRLLPGTLPVLIALSDARDYKSNQVSIAMEDLCRNSGMTDTRYLRPALAELHDRGILRTLRPGKPGRGNRAVWEINFTADPWVSDDLKTPAHETGFQEAGTPSETPLRGTGFNRETPAQTPSQNPAQTLAQNPAQTTTIRSSSSSSSSAKKARDEADGEERDPAKTGQAVTRKTTTPVDRQSAVQAEELATAIASFDRWAMRPPPQGVGFVLRKNNNEHLPVVSLLADLAELPAMPWKGQTVERRTLVVAAVDELIRQAKPFVAIKRAAECVRREIAAWANGNLPKDANGKPTTASIPVVYGRRMS